VYYGYVIVASAFIIMVMMVGTLFSFGVFLTPMLTEFISWRSATLSGAFSMCIIVNGFLGILAGRLSDRFGPRAVVLVCSLFLGISVMLMSQVHTIWEVYLFYGLGVAIGESAHIAPLQSTVAKWFIKRKGLMVSIALMGLTGGIMIIPSIANWLILLHGWRKAYIILGAADLLVISLAALTLKRSPAQIGRTPYGVDKVREHEREPQYMGALSLRQAFHTRQFWLVCAFFFCIAFAMTTVMAHIVPHAINVSISPTIAAIILSVMGGTSTAAVIPEGFMADKIGVRKTAIILTALLVVSMLWLLVTGEALWSLFLFAIMFGLTFSSLDILLALVSSSLFGLVSLGAIIGFVNSILSVGSALGPFVAGLLFDLTGNYQAAFLCCALVAIIALTIVSTLRPSGQISTFQ